jgi:hypothetical protein
MRDRMEPIARGHGEAREGLFVAALCSSHEIGIHASSTWPVERDRLQPIWAAQGGSGLNLLRPGKRIGSGGRN